MEKYDIIVIGASTTGAWFARQMAKRGHSVLVIEKNEKENVSREYDIFHMPKKEMERSGLEIPSADEKDFGFTFDGGPMLSPYGNYPKKNVPAGIIGLHKHDYIMRMNKYAEDEGAKIIFGASFVDFVKDEWGKVCGAKYKTAEGEFEAEAKLVADCSGIPAVARTKMPDDSTVENYKLTPEDIFYVVIYYVTYDSPDVDPMALHASFLNYKAVWSAPSGEPHGAILGIGGNYSYAYAEEIFKQWQKNVPWPRYTVEKAERGMTPYRRSVYSFVDNGFIAMGDAGCMTKPTCGEGCTSSLVQGQIAVDVIDELLKAGKPLTRDNMWPINKKYMDAQGIAFDSMRPLLKGVVSMSFDEAEYLFKKDIIFSTKILGGGGEDLNLTPVDIAQLVSGIGGAVIKGKLKPATVKKIVTGLLQSMEVTNLYKQYPETAEGYWKWKEKADALWEKIGPMSDICDQEVVKRLGIR